MYLCQFLYLRLKQVRVQLHRDSNLHHMFSENFVILRQFRQPLEIREMTGFCTHIFQEGVPEHHAKLVIHQN
jgi:hypothetical protein